ncbi:MAG: hypothetical protein JXA46_18220 [Dehalococcoidales bacterium]|nr:hypothetical protein [Dehalococcoidales bacterium]
MVGTADGFGACVVLGGAPVEDGCAGGAAVVVDTGGAGDLVAAEVDGEGLDSVQETSITAKAAIKMITSTFCFTFICSS